MICPYDGEAKKRFIEKLPEDLNFWIKRDLRTKLHFHLKIYNQ